MDWTSTVASVMCFAHCALLPIALSALPMLRDVAPPAVTAVLDSGFIWLSLGIALPFGTRSLYKLHQVHGEWPATVSGAGGLLLVAATHLPCMLGTGSIIPHEWHLYSGAAGALGLAGAQFYGWRRMRKLAAAPCCAGDTVPALPAKRHAE
mgnify:FL=1